jgi:mono/diheme cytochrome c family protein
LLLREFWWNLPPAARFQHESGRGDREEAIVMRLGSAILGAIILIAIVIAALFALAATGTYDVSADKPHTGLVARAIAYVRERSIESRAENIEVPPLGDAKMIANGAADYDAMCTGCHLAPGMPNNELRPGLNPRPPKLAAFGPGDPKEQFWIVKHGIRMTGMPAWGVTHSDKELWNIVAFLQKLPKLSPEQYRALVKQAGAHHESEEHGEMPMPH